MKKWCLECLMYAIAAALFLSGCSSDGGVISDPGGENGHEASRFDSLYVQGVGDLPSCEGAREGSAYFVRNDNLPYFCVSGEWRKASDSTDFSIACNEGILYAMGKEPHLQQNELDPLNARGFSGNDISGIAQRGFFEFGTSVSIVELGSNRRAATSCILKNDGAYRIDGVDSDTTDVKINVTGYYKNVVTGNISKNPVTLSSIYKNPLEASNVNVLTHLSVPRVEQLLMNHIPFEEAQAQAEREVVAAFNIDPSILTAEYDAVLLAVAAMLQGDRNEGDMMNLINNLAEDIKGDGVWNDLNWKIKIADWVVGMDSSWKYNDIRNNVSSWGVGAVPNFEKYMREFFPMAYGFKPCDAANAGKVTYVNQGQSAYFANDYNHADHSRVRFICDANGFQWRTANAIEKDTAGFGAGVYDREVREGQVNHDVYYIFELAKGAWREATPQEADGFTDIAEVYANLKPDEKAFFIIRHSERTNDTGPSGHLTDNGKQYARDLGARLAKVGTEDFYYGYSGYTRTYETCENIALGKGQANYTIEALEYMDGGWYVMNGTRADSYIDSDGGGWVVYSKYAFLGEYTDAFYDLETRSEQLLKDEILANSAGMKRVNFFCTHDYLIVPLLAYTTDGHANVRYYEKYRWANYLSGVAMILSADGSVRYIPVKGLETGTM